MISNSDRRGPAPGPFFRPALLWIALYSVGGTVLFTLLAVKALPRRGDNTYTEAPAVYAAIMALQSGHIHMRFDAPPYTPQPYGPLFYGYNTVLAKIAGGNIAKTYLLGRVFVYLSFLSCALLIYGICRKLAFPASRAALAALFFMALPYQTLFNVSIRPDFPCVALMLASLLCAMLEEPAGLLAYAPSGLLAGAAFLLKQPGFAVCVAIAAVLVLKRKYAQTAVFLLSAAIPVAAMLAWLTWTHDPVWSQMTVVLGSLWSLPNGAAWMWSMLRDPNKVTPLAALALGFPLAAGGEEWSQMAASFALVNLCAGLATIPQLGGAINYFYPAFAGSAILLPFAIEATARRGKIVQAAICCLTMVWLSVCLSRTAGPQWRGALQFAAAPAAPVGKFQNLRILSDRPSYDLLGRDPEFMDPALLHMLELRGRWDAGPMLEDIRNAKFDLIILANSGPLVTAYRGIAYFSPAEVEAMNENYRTLCHVTIRGHDDWGGMVLQARDRDLPVTAEMLSAVLNQRCLAKPAGTAAGLYLQARAR